MLSPLNSTIFEIFFQYFNGLEFFPLVEYLNMSEKTNLKKHWDRKKIPEVPLKSHTQPRIAPCPQELRIQFHQAHSLTACPSDCYIYNVLTSSL